jgi:site-specific DNA-methyltransferase (adenine-specific)
MTSITEIQNNNPISIKCCDGLALLDTIDNNSVDLFLTDPPYIISKETGMNKLKKKITKLVNGKNLKTEKEWEIFKKGKKYTDDSKKKNYLKYGNVSGKKYSYSTDYGEWDKQFTMKILEKYIEQYYKKLRKGGTIIIWFDLWKITPLKELLEKYKFKQIRMIEWIKTNPIPLNQSVNYLSNAREIALLAVKGGKPTFKGKYDKGIYEYPIQSGKYRFHPTQKNLKLFEEIILKHTNENDLVVDTFLGGGTTAFACKNTNRNFIGCELDKKFYNKIIEHTNLQI